MVRHSPDRPRAGTGRVPEPIALPAATAGAAQAIACGPSISSCVRWRCSSPASMPITCRPACTRISARLHGLAAALDRGGACSGRYPQPPSPCGRRLAVARRHAAATDGPYLPERRRLHRRLRGLSRRLVLQGPPHRLPPMSSLPYPAPGAPGATAWRRSAVAQRTDIDPDRRTGRAALPSPRRRAGTRSRRRAIRCPDERARARSDRQCQGTGSRAR